VDSRSNTESPTPEARSGDLTTRQTNSSRDNDADGPAQASSSGSNLNSSKPMEIEEVAPPSATEGVGTVSDRGSAAFDMTSPMSTDCDRLEDGSLSSRVQEDYSAPSMGYDFSNARVSRSCSPAERHGRGGRDKMDVLTGVLSFNR
jgi:hypothetical protein